MKRKTVLTLLSTVLIVMVSVLATLAYLTDSDSVTNTFTVGQVNITLDETDVDVNGEKASEERVKENEYHLIAGKTYIKDPTITVESGSEESYVRMVMTVYNASSVQKIIDKYSLGDFSALIDGWDETVWIYQGFVADEESNTIAFEFRHHTVVSAGDSDEVLTPLFEKLVVPSQVNGEELKALYDPNDDGQYEDGFKMVIEGHAIQKAGFETEEDAWKAFDEQMTIQ